ncbi:hypothetical protein PPACK8108_LOCUS5346 [Phakopsora pachyrhizi]|uniref:Uncharacterized protein n=1 Tax=Phakopsora pachyrhizi TaxID=170000 RepID=A0AAV0AQ37_PHAPC|nr:hypothetical protein PPACK8108_LOCUS5346 [Phakopsora pachyrhizi]
MPIFNYISITWDNKSLNLVFLIPIFNFVLSTNHFYDYDLVLAPQLGQVTPDLRTELDSLSENSQLLQPLASIDFPSWQDSAHQISYDEHLFSHQLEAIRHGGDVDFSVGFTPQYGQSLAGNSPAHTPNLDSSLPLRLADTPSLQNLAHQNNHPERLVTHQNGALRHEKFDNFNTALLPQMSQAPPESILEISGLPENPQLLHPLACISPAFMPDLESSFPHQSEVLPPWKNSAQHLDIQNENWEVNYQNPTHYRDDYNYISHFGNLNEEKILNDFLEEGNSKGYAVRTNPGEYSSSHQNSISQNQNWSFDTIADFDTVDTQFDSMISNYFQTLLPDEQNNNEENMHDSLLDEENWKKNTVESLNKNKMPTDQTEEVDNPQSSILRSSINNEVQNIFEFPMKALKGLNSVETVKPHKLKRKYSRFIESKIEKANEQKTEEYENLKPNEGSINQRLRLKVIQDGLVGTSGTRFQESDKELKTSLAEPVATYILLNSHKKIYEEEKLSIHDCPLNSLQHDTAWESASSKAIKNIRNTAQETNYSINDISDDPTTRLKALRRILYEELKLQQYNDLASLENFVADLHRRAQPKYALESMLDWNIENNFEKKVEYIIGAFSGETHLKNFNLIEIINSGLERILLKINEQPGRRNRMNSHLKYWLVKTITFNVSNYILLFYRIFTPFDNKIIEEMKTNLVLAIKNMEDFWIYLFEANCKAITPTNAHKKQLSGASIHFKRCAIFSSRKFFWNWMSEPNAMNVQFMVDGSTEKFRKYFINFIEDCSIVDFLESSPLPSPNNI